MPCERGLVRRCALAVMLTAVVALSELLPTVALYDEVSVWAWIGVIVQLVALPGAALVLWRPQLAHAGVQRCGPWLQTLVVPVYAVGLLSLVALTGGVLLLAFEGHPGLPLWDSWTARRGFAVAALVVVGLVTWRCADEFRRAAPRRILFGHLKGLIIIGTTVAGAELVLSYATPQWPARGLHGVTVDDTREGWRQAAFGPALQLNSWGQLDSEHAVKPEGDTRRIALIGDSFLEVPPAHPLGGALAQATANDAIEFINLGVTATAPDEYYYRLVEIALPLDIDHCIMFIFEGNDYIRQHTLDSFFGIAAVYPRPAVLSRCGLHAINHHLTNHRRPVLGGGGRAGMSMVWDARLLQRRMRSASDAEMAELLVGLASSRMAPNVREQLHIRDMTTFYDMLRHPDEGVFRTYYLDHGIPLMFGDYVPTDPLLTIVPTVYWVRRSAEACRRNDIAFTVVIIPEAFQVDARMLEQWLPLADMTLLARERRAVSIALRAELTAAGISCIDLYDTLHGTRGTYLNLDGHWSTAGIDVVAEFLAQIVEAAAAGS